MLTNKLKVGTPVWVVDKSLDDEDGDDQVWPAKVFAKVKCPKDEEGEWYAVQFEGYNDTYDYPQAGIFTSHAAARVSIISILFSV